MGSDTGIRKEPPTQTLYREHTPVETYVVRDRTIYVKRDDLFSFPPAPPLAKLRGIRALLQRESAAGNRVVGCFQTRVSNIGHALAAACQEFTELECIVVYPQSGKECTSTSVKAALALGAKVKPIRSNVLPICYAQAKRILAEMDGVLLPFGMECPEAVDAVAREASLVPITLCSNATWIVPCGSGVTLAGIVRGLPALTRQVIGVSCGRSVRKIQSCISKHVEFSDWIVLVEPGMSYYQQATVACPFPAHPNYDLKAWDFLLRNLSQLPDPIVFWNVGG